MKATMINLSKEFTRFPGGRYRADGPYSGEQFRDDVLLPALQSGSPVDLELDGAIGYGSSFLEEVFGGLVRKGFRPDELRSMVNLKSRDPLLIEEICQYIHTAKERAAPTDPQNTSTGAAR